MCAKDSSNAFDRFDRASTLWPRSAPIDGAVFAGSYRASLRALSGPGARVARSLKAVGSDLRERADYLSEEVARPFLNERLMRLVLGAILTTGASSVLEVGCGEGGLLRFVWDRVGLSTLAGVDLDPRAVEAARSRVPRALVEVGDAYRLPFEAGSFDFVACLGLLEHADRPEAVVAELSRVSRRLVLASVPDEPICRLARLAAGRDVGSWGSKPSHLQRWGRPGFVRTLETRFVVRRVWRSFPWLVALGEKRPDASSGALAAAPRP